MTYLSWELLPWMVATLSGYWTCPPSWRPIFLIAMTAAFLAVVAPLSLTILTGLTALVWFVARHRPLPSFGLVAAVITILAVFLLARSRTLGVVFTDLLAMRTVPIGISYYVLRCLHVLIESSRGRFRQFTFTELAAYLFFLPTIVVGPIHRFGEFQRDFHRVRLEPRTVVKAIERILHGYLKVVFLGNYVLGGLATQLIAHVDETHHGLSAYLWIVQGGLSLYIEFSGYSDIAIGFAALLGFKVMENFNWPYLSVNISEYWRRWHMSLTTWCREYVFGTVVSYTRSPALGTVAALLAIGLWHETSARFVCWGLYHACGLIIWQQFQSIKQLLPTVRSELAKLLIKGCSIAATLHFVWFGLVFVRKPELSQVFEVWFNATLGILE